MARQSVLPAPSLFLALLVLLPHQSWGGGATQPRYRLPADGRAGRVYLEEYFKLDDSRAAARLLLEEAALAQVDVDRVFPAEPRESILIGSGEFTPDPDDRSLVEKAAGLAAQGTSDPEFICLIKLSRFLSIREIANLMDSGVHLYRGVPYYTYIARVNTSTLPALLEREPVVWIGELTPQMKYQQNRQFTPDGPFHVYSLVGDTPECRADLEHLGAKVLVAMKTSSGGHRWEGYVVSIDPARVDELAGLWWVHDVYQEPRPVPKFSTRGARALDGAPASGDRKDAESAKRIPRFVPPADGRPGHVRLEDYLTMKDPRRAARLLLEEAAVAQIDLDKVGRDLRDEPSMDVPAPGKVVDNPARVHRGEAVGKESDRDTTWCVVKFSRGWSIRELASLMESGIVIYWPNAGFSFLARLPSDKREFLATQPFVYWFQPYTAEMKLNPIYRFEPGRTRVEVVSLEGDNPEFRSELKRLGADIEGYGRYGYTVWIDSTRIGDIVKLAWVYQVLPTSVWGL